MDYLTTSSSIASSLLLSHPATLYIGSEDMTRIAAMTALQKVMCPSDSCHVCSSCRMLAEQQHHAIRWLTPEHNYTLEDIEIIHQTTRFSLEPGSHFFFVLEHAERLSISCANSLLKVLEEPPAGYHFLLLAPRADHVLATIRSRCIIEYHATASQEHHHPLFPFFTHKATPDPITFLTALEKCDAHEQECAALLDDVITHWANTYKQAIRDNQHKEATHASRMAGQLSNALETLPMPGSGKLFLKNLFLHISNN